MDEPEENFTQSFTVPMVTEDSPERCEFTGRKGQCRYQKIAGATMCPYHTHMGNPENMRRAKTRKYRLLQHYARVADFTSSPELKNLSEEIGILNFTLETLLNQCRTPWDLQVNQNRIESLVEKITRTTQINIKLQHQIGKVLDENALATFVDVLSKAIIDEKLSDEQIIRISQKMGEALASAFQPKLT